MALFKLAASAGLFSVALAAPLEARATQYDPHTPLLAANPQVPYSIQYGPRPYYIINNMTDGPLKQKLQSCENGPFSITGASVGHRGGADLQFPEESVQSEEAGARMGAGILECDVSFTGDRGLVCRHSLCDLHTTTDILTRPALAAKCTVPFTPANATSPANALCCTSDITTAEYGTLCSKMDGFNASAKNPQDYQHGTPSFRTDLYNTCATPLTLEQYIDLVDSFPGYRNFTPELKTPPAAVPMPFKGYTQEQYARDFIETFIRKGIDPARVWSQSFNPPDIFQWLREYPAFGAQALYLDESGDAGPANFSAAVARLPSLKAQGVNLISPPINYLLTYCDATNRTICPSSYAKTANAAGLDIVAWTFERSGPLYNVRNTNDYYYTSINQAVSYDGQLYDILDILFNQIGIKAIFTDWSATVAYFANCFDLKGPVGGSYYKPAATGSSTSTTLSTKTTSVAPVSSSKSAMVTSVTTVPFSVTKSATSTASASSTGWGPW